MKKYFPFTLSVYLIKNYLCKDDIMYIEGFFLWFMSQVHGDHVQHSNVRAGHMSCQGMQGQEDDA